MRLYCRLWINAFIHCHFFSRSKFFEKLLSCSHLASSIPVLMNIQRGKSENESHSVVSDSLWPHGLYSPWNSPGQNTGVGSCSLLQGTFPTQGSNPGLPHWRRILYQLSYQGNPHFTYKWAVMDDQGLRLSSSSFLCLSKRDKGKGTLSYRGGCHQSEPCHSGCEAN